MVSGTRRLNRLRAFARTFKGDLVLPNGRDYETARAVWNGMIDRHPAAIARCQTVSDVVNALRFARDTDVAVCVRGGGHSVAGLSTCDGGLVIDLGGLREVSVDPGSKVARVQGGALIAQLDAASQLHGLACPIGVVGHTGVGGLTLGGGMGRLQRQYGYTIDNLVGVEIITADGTMVRASETENSALFWGVRGAGANFGVAVSFDLALHKVGPTVMQGVAFFPADRALEVAELAREMFVTASNEISFSMGFGAIQAPDQYPPELSGRPLVQLQATHCGSADDWDHLPALIRSREPLHDTFGVKRYVDVQLMEDDLLSWGHRFYMKNGFLRSLSDRLVGACVTAVSDGRERGWITLLGQGGNIARISDEATAFAGREAPYWCSVETLWDDPKLDSTHIDWARRTMAAIAPFTMAGEYVNDAVAEAGEDRAGHGVRIYGASRYGKLAALKREWDPDNVFHLNHNIPPHGLLPTDSRTRG